MDISESELERAMGGQVLSMIQSYAPNEEAKEKANTVYFEALNDSGPQEALRHILGVLYDGLAYGNWPWI